MEPDVIRARTEKLVLQLGYPVNPRLPVLEELQIRRTPDEAIARLLCMHATAASAYGFDRNRALGWLQQEKLEDALAVSERGFLGTGIGNSTDFKVRIEAIWALAWALSIIPTLDFAKECDQRFVSALPNLKENEGSDRLRGSAQFRGDEEVVAACDVAYCLDWALREGGPAKAKRPIRPYVIHERRRALEWLLCYDTWDDLSLDT